MTEVGRIRNPHVRPEVRHRTMNQRPVSVDSSGKNRGVLIVGRHNDAVTLKGAEVFRQGKRNSRTAARIRSVSNHILLYLGDESNPRVLDTPDFLGKLPRTGHHRRFTVNFPVVDAVFGSRSAKMRQTPTVFDAT